MIAKETKEKEELVVASATLPLPSSPFLAAWPIPPWSESCQEHYL